MVAKARQKTAKPAVKNGEGWEIPCQPCLNSSINFVIVVVISRDQRIQNKAERGGFLRERSRQAGSPAAAGPDQLACLVPGGREYCVQARSTGGTDMGRLDGKVAVITGATSGIGLHTAEIFVAEGAKIVIAGRRAPEGEALAKKLGANCIFRQTDVTVEAQMKALIALSVEKFGRIDCLFNNAGGPAQIGGIEGLDVDRFDAAMATLLRSVMLGMKHAAPYMKKQGSGSIINNGSIAGRLAGFSSSIVYGAAKAGVIHLTKCVAMELGESNVRVNSISPGVIATGIFGKALGLSVEAAEKTPAVMREVTKTAQPIPRAGLPEDIAHAAVFLASDESSFINGHDLVVDGAITGGRNWSQQQQGYVDMRKRFDQGA
jgi:NAD(P)-dependent dehydrogenase (short-subunit alcohol dehydrogenase family)